MISTLALICAMHPAYCHLPQAKTFAVNVDAEVQDERLRAVLVIFAHHESGLQWEPAPQSWDARAHVSCGYLQMRCAFVRTHTIREQVREWLWEVQRGGLPGMCGYGRAAARMAWARVREAERLLLEARQGD